ncbi:50S ribosomal protein L10 [Candidatus Chloroploca asiatica]|uniref:Large ribosomal subunit protein uL10 n=1 Tax=Candidatus Chloroploca asiatica TaxID=1506545 RepID=A0A2H3KR73_9CHLR|nr:50S ribosomal protein L10 [Candidatus Chloroploca asiatica]PDW01040.1 50S ribosomal protein L10 [Candidatus Chloroploca asiatica]
MPTQRKFDLVAELSEKMERSQLAVVADYRGFNVADLSALRAKLRENGAELVVAKNTLLRLAARNTGKEGLEPNLEGPTAVVFAYDDVAKVAKVLLDASKVTARPFKVKGGLLGFSPLQADGLDAVTKLPSREQALASIVGGVAAPVSGVVGVLNAAISNIAYVVQARIDQLQPAGE